MPIQESELGEYCLYSSSYEHQFIDKNFLGEKTTPQQLEIDEFFIFVEEILISEREEELDN